MVGSCGSTGRQSSATTFSLAKRQQHKRANSKSCLSSNTCPDSSSVAAPVPANTLSPTSAPTAFCYGKDPSTQEIIIIFPNTPLHLRSNTRYLCGEDGSSSNDCRLVGGSYQLLSSPRLFDFEDTIGVLVQGLTFEDSRIAGAVLSNAGDVTFVDCLFVGHKGRTAVSMLYIPVPDDRRLVERIKPNAGSSWERLDRIHSHFSLLLENATSWEKHMSTMEAELTARRQQEAKRQFVSFERCLFQSNTAKSNKFIPNNGVIGAKSSFNDLSIDSCLFSDNDAAEPSSNSVCN